MDLSEGEQRLRDGARESILEHARSRRAADLYDVLYAFVLSAEGEIYAGIPLESDQPAFNHCAERHAVNEMRMNEPKGEVEAVFVAGPVPADDIQVTMPCGACRHIIHEFGGPDTTVLASCFVREEDGWDMFPELRRTTAGELYPEAYEPVEWD